jgi:MoxR-like ATPase
MREEIRQIQALMEGAAYITDPAISTAVHLATTLGKPLLVEGHAGVGKTEIAKVLARVQRTNLIRLQCYEGLDASTALYEWNYPKQILRIRLEERDGRSVSEKEHDIFSESFLLKRPLLQAITQGEGAPVLLIDEIDRADVEFESFLLEILSDFQVTVPEIGTTTPRSTRRCASSGRRCRGSTSAWPGRSPASCRTSAGGSSRRFPASPRAWTGAPRWSPSTPTTSMPTSCARRSAAS